MYIGISTSNLSTKVPVFGPAQFVLLDGGVLNDNKYIKCFLWQYVNFPVNREVDCSSLSSACAARSVDCYNLVIVRSLNH